MASSGCKTEVLVFTLPTNQDNQIQDTLQNHNMKQGGIKETIPEFTEDTVAGARCWLASCVKIVGVTFHYIPVNRC